jgi:hypothetical protein
MGGARTLWRSEAPSPSVSTQGMPTGAHTACRRSTTTSRHRPPQRLGRAPWGDPWRATARTVAFSGPPRPPLGPRSAKPAPSSSCPRLRPAARHRHRRGRRSGACGRGPLVAGRGLCEKALRTLGGLTGHTRAVSRLPQACKTLSLRRSVQGGAWPGEEAAHSKWPPGPEGARQRARCVSGDVCPSAPERCRGRVSQPAREAS